MSLNANAKAWTPSFGGGGAPVAPVAPVPAAPSAADALPAVPTTASSSLGLPPGVPPPPPAAYLAAAAAAAPQSPSKAAAVPPPPPAAALAALGANHSSSNIMNSVSSEPTQGLSAPAPPTSSALGQPPLPPAGALGGSSGGLHLAPPFTPGGNTFTTNHRSNNNNNSAFNNNNGGSNNGMFRPSNGMPFVPAPFMHAGVAPFNPALVGAAPGVDGGFGAAEQSDWFRYAVALPSARKVDTTAGSANNLVQLQTQRALLAGRTRDKASFNEYISNYMANVTNSSFTEKEAQIHISAHTNSTTILPPNYPSPPALFLSRKMLGNPSQTEDITAVTNADGYLVQVAAEHTQPGCIVSEYLRDAWRAFMDVIGPESSVIGHWMLEVPEISNGSVTTVNTAQYAEPGNELDSGAAFYHYFFAVPKTPTSLSTQEITQKFTPGTKVTKIRSIVSFILANRLPFAAHVRVHAGSEFKASSAAESPVSSAASDVVAAVVVPAPTITMYYNAFNHAESLESIQKAIVTVEKFLTPSSAYNNAKKSLIAAASASSSDASPASTPTSPAAAALAAVPSWSSTAIVNIDLVDVTPAASATASSSASSNNTTLTSTGGFFTNKLSLPCVVPAFDVLQELVAGLSAMAGGIASFERAEGSSSKLSASFESFMCALKPQVVGKSNSNGNPLVVLSARSALAQPWGSLPSIHAAGSYVTAVGSAAQYSVFRTLVASTWDGLLNAEARTLALTTDKSAAIANVFAREPYVVRRTAVGTRVLLLVDGSKNRKLAIFDPQTGAMLSLPSNSWSNPHANITDSVFLATLTHSYRGARVWRVIVEDVYRFNGESCVAKPFKDRWAHLNLGAMANEGAFSHTGPFGPLILHATYMNIHELHRLMDRNRHTAFSVPTETEYFVENHPINPHEVLEPVDHATLGVTFVPTMAPVLLSLAAEGKGLTYGSELPPKHSKPRSINNAAVRDILKLVPTFTWVPQESIVCNLAVASIGKGDAGAKTVRVYLKSAKSNVIPKEPSLSTQATPDNIGLLGSGSEMLTPGMGTDALLPPPSLGLPAASATLASPSAGIAAARGCKSEPTVELHAKRLWLSWVSQYGSIVCPTDGKDGASNFVPLEGEFVEVPTALVDLGYITVGATIECLIRRAGAGTRYWEYTKTVSNDSVISAHGQLASTAPTTDRVVSWLSAQSYLKPSDLQWLPKAYVHRCCKCNDVSEKGEKDTQTGNFRCFACWRDSGFGDCVHCHKRFTPGSIEVNSKAFYCEGCWQSFTHTVNIVTGPQPPPLGASLELQVMTRVASLLIDEVARKFPLRDVLDLCVPDTSVIRKWLHTGIESFTGVATDVSVISDVNRAKSSFLQDHPNKHRENFNVFPCPFAFSDHDRFWDEIIRPCHPKQFSAIFCFYQLQKVFSSKQSASDFFKYLARALVPGGVFVTTFFCGNGFFFKGQQYRNDYFSLKWNIKEYEDGRARMLAGLPPIPAAPAAAAPRGNSNDRARNETPVGAGGIVRESGTSSPMPPSIDDLGEEGMMGLGTVPTSSDALGVASSSGVMMPTAIDADEPVRVAKSSTPTPAAAVTTTPATPESQVQKERTHEHVDPNATVEITDNTATPSADVKDASGSTSESTISTADDTPITASELATPAAGTPAVSSPLVPSKGAWKPKSLAAAAVSSVATDSAAGTPAAGAEGIVAAAAKVETPVTTELTIPTVGLSYQISFSEAGGTSATGMNREASLASEDMASPSSEGATPSWSRAQTSVQFTENVRVENAITLDLLCACAEESGFELVFDFWGKASDLIQADGAWTKPLNPAAKEYFNGVKTVVFKKIARRPINNTVAAPAGL